MNIAKLRKLKRWILKEPRRYRQASWFYLPGSPIVKAQKPPCGTIACLGGTACLMEGYIPVQPTVKAGWRVRRLHSKKTYNVETTAAEILGLTYGQAMNLFDGNCEGWPHTARELYWSADTPAQQARAAAMAIDALIKKGKRGD